ncbi:MAG: hypothetical protein ACI9UD_002445 [Glaciecola sp.]|jgi:hypothetical protein
MPLLSIFGLGMFILGCYMVIAPLKFSIGIVKFSEKPWFHVFEIASRLMIGLSLLLFAENTSYPKVVTFLGWLLCIVSVFLVLIGANRHKHFAQLASNIGKYFRVVGFIAITCGASLIYLDLV